MKQFAELIEVLATSTKTTAKLEAIQDYFAVADDTDKIWMIALFTGRRPKRSVNSALLRGWCMELANISPWLFEESYHTVGDLAETIALLLPENDQQHPSEKTLSEYLNILLQLGKKEDDVKKEFVTSAWANMNRNEIFVFNKLMTGGFRIGVSQKMMVNALAKTTGISPSVIAHRIIGNWDPATISFSELMSTEHTDADHSKPYPFYLAYAIENDVADLGDPGHWQAEWKWDGIRGQIIKRNDELFVWSRGEELMTEKFPEYNILQELLPNGIAIDGEIISLAEIPENDAFAPLPFSALQTRIGRKNITKKQLSEAPVGFIAYDLVELDGKDLRGMPMAERREKLATIIGQINQPFLHLSPVINFTDWEELKSIRMQARDKGSEGLMLKRKNSAYQVGRKRGDWWKWKIDPLTIDAVMIYAQKGHGRRSNLYTDYTFAVKDGDKLVSFAKAYSGLTDKEFAQVDSFVKRNSIEKFGPVRTVKPELVFELAFEGIAASNRHKSGVALRFPRISRWRKDKKADEINSLEDLKDMLRAYNNQYSAKPADDKK
ncbi:MAG: ATP-dependent ligase LigC [Ferruginibacter sp.]|nr:ATP-dependent ligase LigC [Ferruginibacter sp.]